MFSQMPPTHDIAPPSIYRPMLKRASVSAVYALQAAFFSMLSERKSLRCCVADVTGDKFTTRVFIVGAAFSSRVRDDDLGYFSQHISSRHFRHTSSLSIFARPSDIFIIEAQAGADARSLLFREYAGKHAAAPIVLLILSAEDA